ncbi:unnamed protein product [Acanthoscelides obtectus]|uniref:Uncharacterized protein n=1 Tax=Acanthoscelides obtectus TaxID=200917 RepID=A0A9P0PSE2_ACAOB|nr:unnamed protein product [Acanthoscelides obtectus]CAK1652404.1 hypothetical protein AOBTE_LOCUS17818 [Acanthoscelides obtectus]
MSLQKFKLPTVCEGKPVAMVRPFKIKSSPQEEESWDDDRCLMDNTPPNQLTGSRTPMDTTPFRRDGFRRYGPRNPAPEVPTEENLDDDPPCETYIPNVENIPFIRDVPPVMSRSPGQVHQVESKEYCIH